MQRGTTTRVPLPEVVSTESAGLDDDHRDSAVVDVVEDLLATDMHPAHVGGAVLGGAAGHVSSGPSGAQRIGRRARARGRRSTPARLAVVVQQ